MSEPQYLGLDVTDFPGLATMKQLKKVGFSTVCVYLRHCPGNKSPVPPEVKWPCGAKLDDLDWIKSVPQLRTEGWGFIPTFCGTQPNDAGNPLPPNRDCPAVDTVQSALDLGRADGGAAGDLMAKAKFKKGSIVYFDIESPDQSRDKFGQNPQYANFIKTWAKTVIGKGYTPGIYCYGHQLDTDFNHMEYWKAKAGVEYFWTGLPRGTCLGTIRDANGKPTGALKIPKEKIHKPPSIDAVGKDHPCTGFGLTVGAIATQYAMGYQIEGVDWKDGWDRDLRGFSFDACLVPDPSDLEQARKALKPKV